MAQVLSAVAQVLTSGVLPHADQQGVIFVLCQLLR